MSLLIEFPSNSDFYFTAITIVITIAFEDKIKYWIDLPRSKTFKIMTIGISITSVVLISITILTLLNIIIIMITPILKIGNNSRVFYILSTIPFYYWYSVELLRKEELNKEKKVKRDLFNPIRDLFNPIIEKTRQTLQNYPNLYLVASVILIIIGIIDGK